MPFDIEMKFKKEKPRLIGALFPTAEKAQEHIESLKESWHKHKPERRPTRYRIVEV